MHSVFDGAGAIWDLCEITVSHTLLIDTKAGVISSGRLQNASLEATPQRILMLPGSEGRAHYMRSRKIPIGTAVDAIIEQKVARQDFPEYTLSVVPCTLERCD
jgi:hypothetical protein